jgi:hypothetical protein
VALNSEAWIVRLAATALLTILMTMVAKVVIVKSGGREHGLFAKRPFPSFASTTKS